MSITIMLFWGIFLQLSINFMLYGLMNKLGLEILISYFILPSIVPGMGLILLIYPSIHPEIFVPIFAVGSVINLLITLWLIFKNSPTKQEFSKQRNNFIGFYSILLDIGLILISLLEYNANIDVFTFLIIASSLALIRILIVRRNFT
jgi:hypothetical protein